MEAPMSEHESVLCCFCCVSIPEQTAVLLVIYPTSDRAESQTLFAHPRCLSERLCAGIPKHPALENWADGSLD